MNRHPIAIAREAAGLDQAQLAEAIGAYELEVAGWESGDHYPDPRVAVKLASLLGLSLQEVYRVLVDGEAADARARALATERGLRQIPIQALREQGRLTSIPVPYALALEAVA